MRLSATILLVVGSLIIGFTSCNGDRKTSRGKLQGVHKYYFPDGKVYLEITYKDSVPHGSVKRYYKSGQLLEEATYREGVQHGITKTYYENGHLSAIIPYDSGRIHGVKKRYRKDGSPSTEAPFRYNNPCVGLVELFLSGRPVDNYPTIVINHKRGERQSNRYILEVSLSDQSRRVQFFEGTLTDDLYIGDDARKIKTENGVATIVYQTSQGVFDQSKVNIIARVQTALGNTYITQRAINLSDFKPQNNF